MNYVFDVDGQELRVLLDALHTANKKAAFDVKVAKQAAIEHLIEKLEKAKSYAQQAKEQEK